MKDGERHGLLFPLFPASVQMSRGFYFKNPGKRFLLLREISLSNCTAVGSNLSQDAHMPALTCVQNPVLFVNQGQLRTEAIKDKKVKSYLGFLQRHFVTTWASPFSRQDSMMRNEGSW